MSTRRAAVAAVAAVSALAPWFGTSSSAAPRAEDGQAPVDPTAAVAFQHNAVHDGYSDDPGFTAPLDLAWSRALDGWLSYPLVVDGRVFVTLAQGQAGSSVQALSLATGATLWGPVPVSDTSYQRSMIAYDRGRVFAVNSGGGMTGLDAATGAVAWRTQLQGQYSFDSAPTALDGTVYVPGAGSNQTLYAVDGATGDVIWARPAETGSNTSPTVDDSGIYLTGACSETFRYDLDGMLDWSYRPRCGGGGGRTSVLHDDRLYVRDTIHDGYMSSVLDPATGDLVGDFDSRPPPAFDAAGRIVTVWDGALTVSNVATGETLWHTPPSDYVTAPLVVSHYVVEGRRNGTVEVRDIDGGRLAWRGTVGATLIEPERSYPTVGLATSGGALVVPAQATLSVFAPAPPRISLTDAPAPGAFVRGVATISFSSNLPDGFRCTLDGVASGCSSPVSLPHLADGPHRFTVAHEGTEPTSGSVAFFVDSLAPSVSLARLLPTSARSRTVNARWNGVDAGSGVSLYQLRERRGRLGAPLSDWAAGETTTATSAQFVLGRGRRICVSVRARDSAGTWSDWSGTRCARRQRAKN